MLLLRAIFGEGKMGFSREVQKIRKDSEAQAEFLMPLWTINRTVFSTLAILFYKFNINNDNVIIWLRCFRSCTSTGWFEHRKGEYSIYIANEQKPLDLIALNKFQCWMYRVRDAPPAVWAFYKSRPHRTTATSKSTPLCSFIFMLYRKRGKYKHSLLPSPLLLVFCFLFFFSLPSCRCSV